MARASKQSQRLLKPLARLDSSMLMAQTPVTKTQHQELEKFSSNWNRLRVTTRRKMRRRMKLLSAIVHTNTSKLSANQVKITLTERFQSKGPKTLISIAVINLEIRTSRLTSYHRNRYSKTVTWSRTYTKVMSFSLLIKMSQRIC